MSYSLGYNPHMRPTAQAALKKDSTMHRRQRYCKETPCTTQLVLTELRMTAWPGLQYNRKYFYVLQKT